MTLTKARDEKAIATDTEPRPWWTRRSIGALIFIAGSTFGFALNVIAPLASEQAISKRERDLQRNIADAADRIGNLDRRVEVTRLLFDHYFGKRAAEQKAAVNYLRYQFPEDLDNKSLQAILEAEARKPEVRRQIDSSVAQIKGVGTPTLDRVGTLERQGFQALLDGDLVMARKRFMAAYRAFPTYHNVDEISRKVLTDRVVSAYARGNPALRRRLLDNVLDEILSTYSWGIPVELRPRLASKRRASQ